METYSVELEASLGLHFEITRKVLPGRNNGRPPHLLSYALFVLRASIYCLIYGRRFSHVVLGDLVLLPAALCCRLRARHQRRIVVVYGLDLVYFARKGLLPKIYGIYFNLFRKAQATFSAVIAISSFTAQLAREAGLLNVHIVNPSLPNTALTSDDGSQAPVLPAAFTGSTSRRILQLGRLVPRKGAGWFATSVMPKLGDDIEFFVAGASYDRELLQELQNAPRTTYLGTQPPDVLAALIREADIVVMPNISSSSESADVEGFGLVAVETASLGGVLLASRLQGLADAVLDEVTGTLLEPENPDVWVAAIRRLLSDSQDQIARRRALARDKARIAFSREVMADALVKLMQQNHLE